MNVQELIYFLKKLPNEMPVGLLDITTDDPTYMNYDLKKENLTIQDFSREYDGDVIGKMLFITFKNYLNENPI